MANIELLDRVIAHIKANPESWDQMKYANWCGTAFCVAGHAALMANPTFRVRDGDLIDPANVEKWHSWHYAGAQALGLDPDQAEVLFSALNSLERIEAMRDALAADPGADLYALV